MLKRTYATVVLLTSLAFPLGVNAYPSSLFCIDFWGTIDVCSQAQFDFYLASINALRIPQAVYYAASDAQQSQQSNAENLAMEAALQSLAEILGWDDYEVKYPDVENPLTYQGGTVSIARNDNQFRVGFDCTGCNEVYIEPFPQTWPPQRWDGDLLAATVYLSLPYGSHTMILKECNVNPYMTICVPTYLQINLDPDNTTVLAIDKGKDSTKEPDASTGLCDEGMYPVEDVLDKVCVLLRKAEDLVIEQTGGYSTVGARSDEEGGDDGVFVLWTFDEVELVKQDYVCGAEHVLAQINTRLQAKFWCPGYPDAAGANADARNAWEHVRWSSFLKDSLVCTSAQADALFDAREALPPADSPEEQDDQDANSAMDQYFNGVGSQMAAASSLAILPWEITTEVNKVVHEPT